jgi:hypothetical protein
MQLIALLPHEIEEDHRRSQGISRDNNPDVDSVMDSGESDSEDGKLSRPVSIAF